MTAWSWRSHGMVVGYITTYAISVHHQQRLEFESRSDKVYSIQHYVIKGKRDTKADIICELSPFKKKCFMLCHRTLRTLSYVTEYQVNY